MRVVKHAARRGHSQTGVAQAGLNDFTARVVQVGYVQRDLPCVQPALPVVKRLGVLRAGRDAQGAGRGNAGIGSDDLAFSSRYGDAACRRLAA